MRPRVLVLSLCAVFSLACGRRSASTVPEPEAQPAGPGSDSCAVYIERVASGVRCQEVDAAHCTCELVGAGADADKPNTPPLLDPNAPTEPGTTTPPQPPPAGSTASLVFAQGPSNTTVTCLGGPCPTTTAELITAPYPPVPAAPSGTKIQLEFRAPDHKPLISDYTLYPGTNQIRFTLERDIVTRPDTATVVFQGAPSGTTVECVSGPCPDKKSHSLESFPPIKLKSEEETVLLRFTAPGYRTGTSSYKVTRGSNVMPVLLEKAPTGTGR
jgi:hypothetical protein